MVCYTYPGGLMTVDDWLQVNSIAMKIMIFINFTGYLGHPGTRIFFLVIWLQWSSMSPDYPGGWNGFPVSPSHDGGPHPASEMSSARCHFFGLDVCVKCSTAGCSDSVAVAHRAIGKVANASAGGVWQLSAWFRYGVILCNYEANEVLNQRAWCFFHVFQQFQTVLQLTKTLGRELCSQRGGHGPPRRALSNNNILCCFSFWYLVVQNSDAAWGSELLTALRCSEDAAWHWKNSQILMSSRGGDEWCTFLPFWERWVGFLYDESGVRSSRTEGGFFPRCHGLPRPTNSCSRNTLGAPGNSPERSDNISFLQRLIVQIYYQYPSISVNNIQMQCNPLLDLSWFIMIYCGLLWFTMIY